MSESRKTVREALAALLSTALVGTGKPVKTVTSSKVTTLAGLTPLVAVLSAGSDRTPLTFENDESVFSLSIQVWIIQASGSWTLINSQDALDAIEAAIAQIIETYRTNGATWDLLEYAGPSVVTEVAVVGEPYYFERIPVTIHK